MPLDYKRRIDEAAADGDLREMAKLVEEGAEGARLLSDEEVKRLSGGMREIARVHRVRLVIAVVATAIAVSVLWTVL